MLVNTLNNRVVVPGGEWGVGSGWLSKGEREGVSEGVRGVPGIELQGWVNECSCWSSFRSGLCKVR